MCMGAEGSMLGGIGNFAGTAMKVGGHLMAGKAAKDEGAIRRDLAYIDADYEEDERAQEAENILRAARREQGAARAATAASGVRLDEFSDIPVDEIRSAAAKDAAMIRLSGKRRAQALRMGGDLAYLSGKNDQTASLFRAADAAYNGWKNPRGEK